MMNAAKLKAAVEAEKQKYLACIMKRSETYDGIVIYGAGIYGRGLYQLLLNNGIKTKAFCVTRDELNLSDIDGIPIYKIDDYANERCLFLIAAARPVNRNIVKELDKRGLSKHYIDIPKYADEMLEDTFFSPVMEITTRIGCSVDCRYCPQELLLQRYYSSNYSKQLSFDVFQKCVRKMPADLVIDFSGFSEPFLSRDAIQMLLYANDNGHDIRLYTTFVGMNIDMFHEIENIPFRRVVVHLPDINHYANIPLTDEYFDVLRYAANKRKKDGRSFIDMANCQSEPHPEAANILRNKVMISWNLIDRAGNLDADALTSQRNPAGELYCGRACELNHTVLLPNGDVVLCCMDYGLQHVLGNLLRQSYDEVIHGKEMQRIQKALISGSDILCRCCTAAKPMPTE